VDESSDAPRAADTLSPALWVGADEAFAHADLARRPVPGLAVAA
jgi:hypothetical protein